jgi:hypothetical protein
MLQKETLQEKKLNEKKAFQRFITLLSIVSIIGFAGVIGEAFFNQPLTEYIEALWILIIGIGLIVEVKIQRLRSIYQQGLSRDNFTYIITLIIGLLAIFSGIFSFPQIRINSSSFVAIKGILAIIAIAIIIIQTWFIKKKYIQ